MQPALTMPIAGVSQLYSFVYWWFDDSWQRDPSR